MKSPLVCLTFDFDAISLWLARSMTSPTPISRGEFGAVGAMRLVELLKRHHISSTWFIPGHTLETYPEICNQIFHAGHEIGHHGWTHVAPNNMKPEEEKQGLIRASESIKKLTGKYPLGYRSPSWDLSDQTVDLLLEHGFTYDSSMMAHDYVPYFVRQGDMLDPVEPVVFGKPSQLIEMPVSWSLDDYPHFEFTRVGQSILPGLMNANAVLENWIEDFLYLKESVEWGIITYTFHPFVIGRGHRMRMMERLIKRLKAEHAEFVTMSQAVSLYQKRVVTHSA